MSGRRRLWSSAVQRRRECCGEMPMGAGGTCHMRVAKNSLLVKIIWRY